MTDKVLTAEEKEALLEGVESGHIEVQTGNGPRYAEVKTYEIPPRCRLVSNSFPRLRRMNSRVASALARNVEQLVSAEVAMTAPDIEILPYGNFGERLEDLSLTAEFTAAPLDGRGLVVLGAQFVSHLVDAFCGGTGGDAERHAGEFFTPGELRIASLFVEDLLASIADVWQPLMQVEHVLETVHHSNDIIDGLEASDDVIVATFEIGFLDRQETLFVVWPTSMLTPLLPAFEGRKRDRNPEQDALWDRSLRSRVKNSIVEISSRVGNSQMTLRDVAALKPGDVIDIADPRHGVVYVKEVPV
nr:FliM/FliN family flagellar motor switch protein [Woeseiaceae bacterium]